MIGWRWQSPVSAVIAGLQALRGTGLVGPSAAGMCTRCVPAKIDLLTLPIDNCTRSNVTSRLHQRRGRASRRPRRRHPLMSCRIRRGVALQPSGRHRSLFRCADFIGSDVAHPTVTVAVNNLVPVGDLASVVSIASARPGRGHSSRPTHGGAVERYSMMVKAA
jgi:hypothetical protein